MSYHSELHAETARTPRPATPKVEIYGNSVVKEGEPFDCFGFTCRIDRDGLSHDWPMMVDGECIGYARTKDAARTTISEHCEELRHLTDATTKDIEAERVKRECERCGSPWSSFRDLRIRTDNGEITPVGVRLCDPCYRDGEKLEPITDLNAFLAGPYAGESGANDWAKPCDPVTEAILSQPDAIAVAAPAAPPRTVAELREELEAVTDAIHDRKAVGAGYANLHRMREQIITELDAAHKVEDTHPNYAALSDAASVEPWIAEPAPTCANCGQAHVTQRCPEVLAALGLTGYRTARGALGEHGPAPRSEEIIRAMRDGDEADDTPLISPDGHDPCAGVKREREELLAALKSILNEMPRPVIDDEALSDALDAAEALVMRLGG